MHFWINSRVELFKLYQGWIIRNYSRAEQFLMTFIRAVLWSWFKTGVNTELSPSVISLKMKMIKYKKEILCLMYFFVSMFIIIWKICVFVYYNALAMNMVICILISGIIITNTSKYILFRKIVVQVKGRAFLIFLLIMPICVVHTHCCQYDWIWSVCTTSERL